MREKLIELLGADTCKHDNCCDCEHGENRDNCISYLKSSMADHLIANGVTIPVRCKDCKEWLRNRGVVDSPNGHCFYHETHMNGYDFCSYGERRSDAETD